MLLVFGILHDMRRMDKGEFYLEMPHLEKPPQPSGHCLQGTIMSGVSRGADIAYEVTGGHHGKPVVHKHVCPENALVIFFS